MMWEELWGIFLCGHACQCGMVWVCWLEALHIFSYCICKLHIQYLIYKYIYICIYLNRKYYECHHSLVWFASFYVEPRGKIYQPKTMWLWLVTLPEWVVYAEYMFGFFYFGMTWIDCHLNTLTRQTLREKDYWLCCSFNLVMVSLVNILFLGWYMKFSSIESLGMTLASYA